MTQAGQGNEVGVGDRGSEARRGIGPEAASAINDIETGFAWACAQTSVMQRRADRGDISPAGLTPFDGRR